MKSTLKKGLYLFSFSILVSLMASCVGSNNYDEIYSTTDAELLSFQLSSDSVPGLVNVVFTINQEGSTGLIYNYDSMAYQTEIKDKVIVTYTSGTGTNNNVLNITNSDSVWVKSGDSIDISQPLTLKVYALNGTTVKLYNVQLNIHQIDPDSVQYHRIASEWPFLETEDTKTVVFKNRFLTYSRIDKQIQLYSSSDAENWTQGTASGLPDNAVIGGIQSSGDRLFAYTDDGELYVRNDSVTDQWVEIDKPASVKVKSILGYLNVDPKQPEGLSLVIETEGIYTFAFFEGLMQWEYDSISPTPIPDDFPLYHFSNYNYQLMYTARISVFGGVSLSGVVQNSVWSTENGRYWAKLSGSTRIFPPLEGANIFRYNNEFWLINGKLGDDYNKDIYYSTDEGVTWQTRADKCQAPEDYPLRYDASLVTDKDNKYFYIIGGKQATVLPDVWKGFLNKMEFEH